MAVATTNIVKNGRPYLKTIIFFREVHTLCKLPVNFSSSAVIIWHSF